MIFEIYYFCCRPSLPVWRGCASPPPSCRGKPTFCESTNIGGGGYRGATNIGVFCTFFLWVDIYQTWLRLRAAKDRKRQLTPVPKILFWPWLKSALVPQLLARAKSLTSNKMEPTIVSKEGDSSSPLALLLLLFSSSFFFSTCDIQVAASDFLFSPFPLWRKIKQMCMKIKGKMNGYKSLKLKPPVDKLCHETASHRNLPVWRLDTIQVYLLHCIMYQGFEYSVCIMYRVLLQNWTQCKYTTCQTAATISLENYHPPPAASRQPRRWLPYHHGIEFCRPWPKRTCQYFDLSIFFLRKKKK